MEFLFTPWRRKYVVEGEGRGEGCVFCGLQEEEDRSLLFETEHWYGVLNAFPYCNGHMMIVARRHVSWLGELGAEELAELGPLMRRAEAALRIAYSPEGMNMGINFGSAGGAGIPGHLHVHLLPRWAGDTNFMSSIGRTRVVPEDLERSFERLGKAWKESDGAAQG